MSLTRKLLPCPFCDGPPELDTQQAFRRITDGKMGKKVAIYCTSCIANMSFCHEEGHDMTVEDMVDEVARVWNTRAALAPSADSEPRQRVEDWLPDDGAYIIKFDDADREDELFAMTGAKKAALRRYEQISGSWNAHLFVKINSNSRDVLTPATASEPAAEVQGDYSDYDAGLLNDFGGGNVDWWQDYIRAEIGRANDFWRSQIAPSQPKPDEPVRGVPKYGKVPLPARDDLQAALQDLTVRELQAAAAPDALAADAREGGE